MDADVCAPPAPAITRNRVSLTAYRNSSTQTDDGITGPREAGKIGFASLRAGGVIGEHTVLFGSDDELLTLCSDIRDAQLAEIAQMQDWLQEWYDLPGGRPVGTA